MRFADTNIFIGFLIDPVNELEETRSRACHSLIQRVQLGEEEIATTEGILLEVTHVLTSPRQFGLSRAEVVGRLKPILSMTGCKIVNKNSCLAALDLYASHSFLDFVDALLVVNVERRDPPEVYSYDSDFDRMPGVVRVVPPLPHQD